MMHLAFYIGGGNWFDKGIAIRTGGPESHVEIVFSDGMSFSSSQWDGGTRFKQIDYSDRSRWFLVPLFATPPEEDSMRERCRGINGKPYGWKLIVRHLITGNGAKDDPNAWICSEACIAAVQHAMGLWGFALPSDTNPHELALMAMARAETFNWRSLNA